MCMKRTFLAKLQRSALYCLIGTLLLVLGVPLYQIIVLNPAEYSGALNTLTQTLRWINGHGLLFAGYRALLVAGFALMLGMPFALFRIIVAQEIIGRAEIEEQDAGIEVEQEENEETEKQAEEKSAPDEQARQEQQEDKPDGMPEFPWRGKGYPLIAPSTGLLAFLFSPPRPPPSP